jgi:tetratricopeptide (TPR) repeat protein
LNDEPVEATPPSTAYRLKKFLRRNRGPVLTAAVIFLLLVGGVVGTAVGLVRAERARQTTDKSLDQVLRTLDILGWTLEDLDPWEEKEGRPLRTILEERLDRAAAELDGEAVGDPLIMAELQEKLGTTYLGLGHAAKAESLFTKALATREAHLGADHPLTLRKKHDRAMACHAAGKRAEAVVLLEQVRDAQVKVLGADHPDTLFTLTDLARAYELAGNVTEAVVLLEQVRDVRVKQLREDDDRTLDVLAKLAAAYLAAGKKAEAISLSKQVLDARVKKHGDDHLRTLVARSNLASAYRAAFKMKEALVLYEQVRNAIVPKVGLERPQTLTVLDNLAIMYRAYRRIPEAIALAEQVRVARVRILGARHPDTLLTLNNLALAYQAAGELDEALPLFQQAAAGAEKLNFEDASRVVYNLYECHEQLKQYDQAELWRRKWLAVVKEKVGPESAACAEELTGLGSNLLRQRKHADAEPVLRECLAVLRKKQPEAWETFHIQSLLGAALLGQEKYAEAEPLLVQGYQGMRKSAKDPGHHRFGPSTQEHLTEALGRLVQLYAAWGKPEQAARWRQRLEERGPKPKP